MLGASLKFSFFLLAATLLQESVIGFTSYSYVRVEIAPYYSSIKANCSAAFKASLQSQIQGWVNDGIALYFGQRYDQPVPYNLTYQSGWNGQWKNNQRALEEQVPEEHRKQLRVRSQTTPSSDRKLCSTTTCYKCCSLACIIYCGCHLCKGSRRLDSSSSSSSKFNSWSMSASDEVSFAVQVFASKWLSEYDATGCMGNPWQADVTVDFVKNDT